MERLKHFISRLNETEINLIHLFFFSPPHTHVAHIARRKNESNKREQAREEEQGTLTEENFKRSENHTTHYQRIIFLLHNLSGTCITLPG